MTAGLHEDWQQRQQTNNNNNSGGPQHSWIWTGSTWHCTECFKQTTNRAKNRRKCEGLPPSMRVTINSISSTEHSLVACVDNRNRWCITCMKCGSWGMHKAINLQHRCNAPSNEGKRVLRCLEKHKHPDGTSLLGNQPVKLEAIKEAKHAAEGNSN